MHSLVDFVDRDARNTVLVRALEQVDEHAIGTNMQQGPLYVFEGLVPR